jgi:hypothetical protein
MIEVPRELTRKWSLILKLTLPSSTEMSSSFVKLKAPGPSSKSVAGMQIDESDEQREKACDPMRKS